MNIFYLHHDPKVCARYHNDKHVVKMILESCQLLSTAHRILDGEKSQVEYINKRGHKRNRTIYKLHNNVLDKLLYQATHVNHPSAKWVRENRENYIWLANLAKELCLEYTRRYGKEHSCYKSGLIDVLFTYPKNLPDGKFTQPPQAMPNEFKVSEDSITAYRLYYAHAKRHLAKWRGNLPSEEIPDWYEKFCEKVVNK